MRASRDGAGTLDAGAAFDGTGETGQPWMDGGAGGLDAAPIDTAQDLNGAVDARGEAGMFATDSGKRPFDAGTGGAPPEAPDAAGPHITDAAKRGDGGDALDAVASVKDAAVGSDTPLGRDVPVTLSDDVADIRAKDVAPEISNHEVADTPPDLVQGMMDVADDLSEGVDSTVPIDTHAPGRLIVIGHDFSVNEPTVDKILGNAILLSGKDTVVVAAYAGAASPTSIANANTAIEESASNTSQTLQWNPIATADGVPASLVLADVFLIYGQENATNSDLKRWAGQWKDALMAFVGSGGTIVLLDGYYAGNQGTSLIAKATGLLAIEPRYGATGISCDVLAPSDPLVAGLPSGYQCPRNSVRLTLSESGANVTTVVTAGNPVVIDKVF